MGLHSMVIRRLALGFGVQFDDDQDKTAPSSCSKTVRFSTMEQGDTLLRDNCIENVVHEEYKPPYQPEDSFARFVKKQSFSRHDVVRKNTIKQDKPPYQPGDSFAKFVKTRDVVRENAINLMRANHEFEKTFINNTKESFENRKVKLKRNDDHFTCTLNREVIAQQKDSENDKKVYELAVKKRQDMYDAYMECKMAKHLERYEFRKKLKEKYSNDPELLASFHTHMAKEAGFKKIWGESKLVRERYEKMLHHSIGSRDEHGNMFYGEGEFPEVPADENRWERMPTWWDDV